MTNKFLQTSCFVLLWNSPGSVLVKSPSPPQNNSRVNTTDVISVLKHVLFYSQVPVDQQEVPAENAHQPTRLESFFAITKSLILRALIFYFITSFFRRPAPTPADQAGSTAPVKLPAFNYFENGSIMVNEDEF